ncbi:MAG: inorganic phosphate transporter [Ignavibacteria bacterium]|nr:inorganic phosphate transporter [Ignavibacteria bacterium]
MIWFYLTSGLFLGWSLGANDAGNIYGTALSTKMLRFSTAAIITSVFVMLGAMITGFGTTHTLGALGDVNSLAGSFTVALSTALTVFLLMKRGLVISVSQAIVGAIIGWNLFTSSPTDYKSLALIVFSWILNPFLAGLFSFIFYYLFMQFLKRTKMHLLEIDYFMKAFAVFVIAFGAYSLGANNIANVVGVFVTSSPFKDVAITSNFIISPAQQLFFVGALAMVTGIATYSRNTTETVGTKIFKLTPTSSLASILGASVVLFLFSSTTVEKLLNNLGLPSFPLVPVSITQAIVGAVIGIGFAKGGRYINYKILGKIGLGWIITPAASGVICLVLLFIMQNVFNREVYTAIKYEINRPVVKEIEKWGVPVGNFTNVKDSTFESQQEFRTFLTKLGYNKEEYMFRIFKGARVEYFRIDSNYAKEKMSPNIFSVDQINSIKSMHNESFTHKWMLIERMMILSEDWRDLPNISQNEYRNKELSEKRDMICDFFKLK